MSQTWSAKTVDTKVPQEKSKKEWQWQNSKDWELQVAERTVQEKRDAEGDWRWHGDAGFWYEDWDRSKAGDKVVQECRALLMKVAHWSEQSDKKAGMIYKAIDDSDGFYSCPVEKASRSRMNVPFTIANDDAALTKKFLEEAKKVKLYTLAGHRSVGGCRASLYNGMPYEGVEALHDFMKSFMDENRK